MQIEGLKGRTAIVTAAGQNIGRAIALAFARAGANVVVNGLTDLAKLEGVAREAESFGIGALPVLADASDWPAVDALVARAVERFGGVDIAVPAVGIRPRQAFEEISVEDWDRVVRANLDSAFYLDRAVLPGMRQRRFGRIIHLSGSDAIFPMANRAHVIASKAGLHGLAKAIAVEYGPDGITANSIAPGWIDTPMLRKAISADAERERKIRGRIQIEGFGAPEDVGWAVVYLCSEAARYVTGVILPIDGGGHASF